MEKLIYNKNLAKIAKMFFVIFAILFNLSNSTAQVVVPFAKTPNQIFSVKGDYTMFGNTNLIRVPYSDEGQNGNNDMGYVDIDNVASTWNSSSSDFDFAVEPGVNENCTQILYAALYWTGRANNGGTAGNTVNATRIVDGITQNKTFTKNEIKLKAGNGAYQNITGNYIVNPPTDYYQVYSCYADVTEYVRTNGSNTYTVADMALVQGNADGVGYFGCWSMVVVYENSKMKTKDIAIFNGHAFNSTSNIVDIPVTGFQAVQSGPVKVKLGFLAGEGDRELTGDYAKIQVLNTPGYQSLVHGTNATNNFFNSSINTGSNSRNPSYLNNNGIDIAMFDIDNPNNSVIANGQTSTTIRVGTTSDVYTLSVLVFGVDAYKPETDEIIKLTQIDGQPATQPYTVTPGQELSYCVDIKNVGTEAIKNYKLSIPIPSNADFVPGSVTKTVHPLVTNLTTPLPVYNSTTRTLDWNFGNLPLHTDINTILATYCFKLRATTNCFVLNAANCTAVIPVTGKANGTGVVTNTNIVDQAYILGYIEGGECSNEAINGILNATINAAAYSGANCSGDELDGILNREIIKNANGYPVINVSILYPPGTRFYSAYPVVQGTIEYTAQNPFPAEANTVITYYAVPPGTNACPLQIILTCINNCVFTVTCGTQPTANYSCSNPYPAAVTTLDAFKSLYTATTGQNPCFPIKMKVIEDPNFNPCTSSEYIRIYKIYQDNNGNNNYDTGEPFVDCNKNFTWLRDITLPTYSCNPAVPVLLGCKNSGITANDAKTAAGFSDNCGAAGLVVNAIPGAITTNTSCIKIQDWMVTATDACGNTASVTVQVQWTTDTEAPVFAGGNTKLITLPGCNAATPTDAEARAAAGAVTDNCGTPTVTVIPANATGNCWKLKVFTVKAVDACGNTTNCIVTYRWKSDNVQPTFSNCQSGTISLANNTAPTAAQAIAQVGTINDNCGAVLTVVATPGTVSQTGNGCNSSQPWTVTATDSCGNSRSCNFTYAWGSDLTPPTFSSCPSGTINLGCNPNPLPNVAMAQAAAGTANDNSGNVSVTVSAGAVSGACSARIQTFTVTATDGCGNSTNCSVKYTWKEDTQPPVFTTPAPPEGVELGCLGIGGATSAQAITAAGAVTDNCGTPTKTAVGGPITGECHKTQEWTVTATDGCNNSTVKVIILKWSYDVQNPTFTNCPTGPIDLGCNPVNLPTANTIQNLVGITPDNCGNVVLTVTPGNITGNCNKSQTFIATATDGCNNVATCSITYTWKSDLVIPTFANCPSSPIVLPMGEQATAAMAVTAVGQISDNCSTPVVTTTVEIVNGTCGAMQVFTVKATDFCGNFNTCQVTYTTVGNTEPPVFTNPPLSPFDLGCNPTNLPTTTLAVTNAGPVTDDVRVVSVVATAGAITGTCVKTQVFTVKATDDCGNVTTVLVTFTWKSDTVKPVFVNCPSAPIHVPNINNINDQLAIASAGTATDNCSTPAMTVSHISTNGPCGPTQIYTVTATDACGNTATCIVSFTTNSGSQPPVFQNCPQNPIDLGCNPENLPTPGAVAEGAGNVTDDGEIVDIIVTAGPITGPDCNKSQIFTVTAIDDCGNQSNCLITYKWKVDLIKPRFPNHPGGDVNLGCNPASLPTAAQAIAAIGTIVDNCGVANTTATPGPVTGSCIKKQVWTIEATDICGNRADSTITYTWKSDLINPVIICPANNANVQCSNDAPGSYTTIAQFIAAGGQASDNCTETNNLVFTKISDIVTGTCATGITISRTYQVTDECGNKSTCVQIINVVDNTPPVITSGPPTVNVVCASDVPVFNIASVTATDNCSNVTITFVSDVVGNQTCTNRFTVTRTYRATDACGNFTNHVQIINVNDNVPPTLTTPPAITGVQCGGSVPAPYATTAAFLAAGGTASDNCTGGAGNVVTVTFVNDVSVPGNCPNSYIVTRTYRATDACGNSSTATQMINISDTTPPAITPPGAVNVICASDVPAPNIALVTASDNCSGTNVVITFENDVISNQMCANKYTITRTYKATDACGNFATAIQIITVNDNVAPIMTAPPAITGIQCSSAVPAPYGNATQYVAAGGTISDNCVGTIVVVLANEVVIPGTCENKYTITRTYRATDVCGNSSTANQTIVINDNTPPVITCPAPITVVCASDVPAANTGLVTTSDNCSGVVAVTVAPDVISNQSCANQYTISRTYTATDICGNAASCTQIITVNDNVPPSITCPNDLLLECSTEVPAPNVSLVQASDNCAGAVTVTHVSDVVTDQTCLNQFTIERTYRATDVCGNSSTCIQYINVSDITPPVITCPVPKTVLCASEIPAPDVNTVEATDNCVGVITKLWIGDVISEQTCDNRFIVTRTYSATDVCGNVSTCTQTITVFDDVPPVIFINDPVFNGVENGGTITMQCYAMDPEWTLPTLTNDEISATDNCGGVLISMNQTVTEGSCETDGFFKSIHVEIVATDFCNNQSSFTFDIHIIDELPPVFTVIPPNTTVSCTESNIKFEIKAEDECECADITFTDNIEDGACAGSYIIHRTYTAKDCCGNMSIHTQLITIVDDTPPAIIPQIGLLADIKPGDTLSAYCGANELPEWLYLPTDQLVAGADGCSDATAMGFQVTESNQDACWLYGYSKLYTVSFTATDDCGNQSKYEFYVKVIDTIAPEIMSINEFVCEDENSWPVAFDNCSQMTYDFSDAPVANECASTNNFIRTWTISDACQNSTFATQYVIANDHTAPEMTMINPDFAGHVSGDTISIECADWKDVSKDKALSWIEAQDKCDFITVDFNSSRVNGSCEQNGYKAVIAYQWTAADYCGNQSNFVIYYKLSDNTPPVFNTNHTVVNVDCENSIPQVKANDNCGEVTLTVVRNKFELGCPNNFTMEETYTATDLCGNQSTFSRIVNVVDTTGPIIYVPEAICEGDLANTPPFAVDYCNNKPVQITVDINNTIVNCNNTQYYTITYSAADYCGNKSHLTQKVIVNDNTAPTLGFSYDFLSTYNVVNNTIYTGCADFESFIKMIDDSGAIVVSDECESNIQPTYSEVAGQTKCEGAFVTKEHFFEWRATDVCGNQDSLKLRVVLEAAEEFDFSFIGSDTTVYCNETVELPTVLPTLNCTQVSLSSSINLGQATPDGSYIETREYTYTNLCGEEVSHTQVINHSTQSDMSCNIVIPEVVSCNSSNNLFTVIVVGGDGPYTYNWEILNGFCHIIGGQGTPTVQISISFKTLYLKVTITDARGCKTECVIEVECTLDGPSIVVVEPDPVDISSPVTQFNLIEDYSLRPNPTSSQVYLEFDSQMTEDITVNISNQFGKVVYHKKMNSIKGFNSQLLETSNLPSGLYQVSLISSDKIKTLQLIKVK